MAENIRDYFDILEELFSGKDAALAKYAKVRFTQYEMRLWWDYNLPLHEVSAKAKRHFNERFLGNNERIDKADSKTLNEAFERLSYAVGKNSNSGCHGRCLRLVAELNQALERDGLETIKDPEAFLDYFTFNYSVQVDYKGSPVLEPGYSFEIRYFNDAINRKEFCRILKFLKSSGKKMSMQDIWKLIIFLRKNSKAVN